MKTLKQIGYVAAAAGIFLAAAPKARPQASFSANTGSSMECPYGYHQESGNNCAPDGSFGPEWFVNGVLVGARPWVQTPQTYISYVDGQHRKRSAQSANKDSRNKATHDPHGKDVSNDR
jgi:hypothetical protein